MLCKIQAFSPNFLVRKFCANTGILCRFLDKSLKNLWKLSNYRTFPHRMFGRKSCILHDAKVNPSNINRLISKLSLLFKCFVFSKMKNLLRMNILNMFRIQSNTPMTCILTIVFIIISSQGSRRKKLSNYFNYQGDNAKWEPF